KREGICIFSLDGEQGVHKSGSLLGEMPRNSRFGYVFTSSAPSTKNLARTIAHELGHGLFTLQHTFDDEYGGDNSRSNTANLMDYGTGTDLAAFQWNIMSKPAVFTALDSSEDSWLYGKIWFTPDWRPFKFGDHRVISGSNTKPGTVPGIRFNGRDYMYKGGVYACDGQEPLDIDYNIHLSKDSQAPVYLFGISKDCKTPTYSTTYAYAIQYKERIDYNDVEHVHPEEIWECPNASTREEKSGSDVKIDADIIERQLLEARNAFGSALEVDFFSDGEVYYLDSQGQLQKASNSLTNQNINEGMWTGKVEKHLRFTTDSLGVIQVAAFGINPDNFKILKTKEIDLEKVSENIRTKTNTFLKTNNATDLGSISRSTTDTFADGGRIEIDGTFAKVISEGIEITSTLLKTGEIQSSVYLSSSDATIKAPGLVTGSTEVVAQKVTDLTSLGVLVYDIATDADTRRNLKQQFEGIKEQVGEDPKEFFSILREVILTMGTGNTLEEWNKSLNSKDDGERSHLATRGVGNTILSLTAGSAIIGSVPDMAENLKDAVKKVKRISNTLDDFIIKSLPDKLEDIRNIWKTKYPLPEMFEGRTIFEDIMGHYRYLKTDGWKHTADIADNFKGVDFYKGIETKNIIYAETAVSMKTTIRTDVNRWLGSESIKNNIKFLNDGLSSTGLRSNGKLMKIENAKIHIYMPKENITPDLIRTWIDKLNKVNPKIDFEIRSIDEFIK
ncbi:hypothetical protein, partial [Porphyromonas somerae]|uniref:hypothetical protein n=1 Tax=Porphyromonas somerae TaxID=322095 RepID=UPI002A8409E5